MTPIDRSSIVAVLEESRGWGFLGPGSVDEQFDHACAFAAAAAEFPAPRLAVDLGSGGGLPGLVLAAVFPATTWFLVDANRRRVKFLADAINRLGLDNARVAGERAEVVGRDPRFRARVDLVVARSFGPPAVTAECAAPLLRMEGWLIVSEPPPSSAQDERWPAEALAKLGMSPRRRICGPPAFQVIQQDSLCGEAYPRRTGIPTKRRLF